jgi:sarcosine oxidase, subunit alpha
MTRRAPARRRASDPRSERVFATTGIRAFSAPWRVIRDPDVSGSGSGFHPLGPWLNRPAERAGTLRWGEERLPAGRGDTVSLTLLDHGIVETSRSVKFRRPRGPYCFSGDCGTCLVRVDGRPNQRACLTSVRSHTAAAPQNLVVEVGPDPTRLVDKVMRGGMDHHHFMVRPRLVNQAMQAVARGLTGLGTLPDSVPEAPSQHVEHAPDVLVIGAGAAGRAAALLLTQAGLDVRWVERAPAGPEDASGPIRPMVHTGVFGAYPAENLWSAMTDDGRGPPTLHTFRPRHVLLCVGARDPMIPLPANDLPGVVAARGLLRQLQRVDATLQVPVVVIGDGPHATGLAASLGARAVAIEAIDRLAGGRRIEEVVTRTERIDATLVALAPTPAPAHDLPRQAGARVRWDGAGFATVRDAEGRCAVHGSTTVWAAGDVAGWMGGPGAAADDGRRVAEAIVARQGAR